MPNLTIVSIRDSAVDAFMRPVFVPSPGAAVRSFTDEVNRASADNEMNRHPSDYILYELGTFNDSNGTFSPLPEPRQLVRAIDVIQS